MHLYVRIHNVLKSIFFNFQLGTSCWFAFLDHTATVYDLMMCWYEKLKTCSTVMVK